jgi:hypothetical protein
VSFNTALNSFGGADQRWDAAVSEAMELEKAGNIHKRELFQQAMFDYRMA